MRVGKTLFLLAGLGLLTVGALALGALLPKEEPRFSSLSTQAEGTKALYLLLEEQEVPTSRWRESWDRLPASQGHVLFLMEPDRWMIPEEEKDRLFQWVESGNTLVLLAHPLDSVANQLGFSGAEGGGPSLVPMAEQQAPWLREIDTLFFPRDRRLIEDSKLDEVLQDQNGTSRIGRMQAGAGAIYYIPEPLIWTNAYIKEGDNLALALYFASLVEGEGKVWFDESLRDQRWNQAFLTDEEEEVPGYLDLIPATAGLLLLQALVLFLLWMYREGKRFAAPRWETVREVRRGEEYFYAMGSLYQWADLKKEVLEIQWRALVKETATILGLSRQTDADRIVERVEALVDPALAGRYQSLQQVMEATPNKRLSGKELVKWSREIQDLREELNQWKTKPLNRQPSPSDPKK